MTITLWPHQEVAIASAVRAFEVAPSRHLWVMPTGTGKTRAFADLARRLGLPTLVVVHREELARQAVATFADVWPEAPASVLARDDGQRSHVLVATVQSLVRKLDRFGAGRFGLVVLDEAHHVPAASWQKVVGHFAPGLLLGCTATPVRLDGDHVGGWFADTDPFVYTLDEAMDAGRLVPVRQHAVCKRRSKSAARGGPRVQRPMCPSLHRLGTAAGLTIPAPVRPPLRPLTPDRPAGAWRP